MPHGAGHVAGGHHGGGFHHHHHHHHFGHHHHQGRYLGAPVYIPYGYNYRRRRIVTGGVFIFVFVIAVPLSLTLGLHFGTSSGDTTDNMEKYSLTDKVLLTYNYMFCQELQAESTEQLYDDVTEASLSILNGPPPLSDVEFFNLTETFSLSVEGTYEQYNFLLNKGSHMFLNVCLTDSYSSSSYITFYVIKGEDNFHQWKDDVYDYYELSRDVYSVESCTTITYNVTESDRYYFAFYKYSYDGYTQLNTYFRFKRTVYHVSPDTVISHCSFPLNQYYNGGSKCSVGVPLSSRNSAILSFNTSLPVDYDQAASVVVSCSQPRAWLYAVLVVGTVVPMLVCVVSVCVCVCVCVKRRKKKYHPLSGDNTTAGNVIAPEAPAAINVVTNGTTATPPAAGGYGSTMVTAPPPYTQ